MIITLAISIIIFIILMGALVWVVHESKKNKKQLTDFYAMFLMGLIWIPIGLAMKNYALIITGLIFVIMGLTNKDEWEKDIHQWKHLNKKEKKLVSRLILVLAIIFFFGLLIYFLLMNKIA